MTTIVSFVMNVVLLAAGTFGDARHCSGHELSLQCRIDAQTAIEEVYFKHTLGKTTAFDQSVSRLGIERKVHRYLQRSAALEQMWGTPITEEMLHAELSRIVRDTRMPERLLEVYEALNHDYALVLECFVRPILVERLTDHWLAPGGTSNDNKKPTLAFESLGWPTSVSSREEDVASGRSDARGGSWEEWLELHADAIDESKVRAVVSIQRTLPVPSGATSCPRNDTWDNGSLADIPEEQFGHTSVWTGSLMLSWGGFGVSGTQHRGFRYDPLTNTWSRMSIVSSPIIRLRSKSVWTGSEMVIWGGDLAGTYFNTGGRYDPVLDVWHPINTVGAPSGRSNHSVVWTDSEMIVFGGLDGAQLLSTGAAYNPASDSWRPIASAPEARSAHTAVWTGSEMIAWGGSTSNTGSRYDPVSDTWASTSTVGAPVARFWHSAVWTGSRMIVWGGLAPKGGQLVSGGRYDPVADQWASMSTLGAPEARFRHAAVWTGSLMLTWGGEADGPWAYGDGGRYNPTTDTWTPISLAHAPPPSMGNTLVWTGTHMISWGGFGQDGTSRAVLTGGRYDPVSDAWSSTFTTSNAPPPRNKPGVVWTGALLLVWGGCSQSSVAGPGGRYDPLTDSWSLMSTLGAPEGHCGHTAVWSGDRMMVWGGVGRYPLFQAFNSGSIYDPIADEWNPMTDHGAPVARMNHGAVWTGREMLIWGGLANPGLANQTLLNTGGRYDPGRDEWSPISTTNAPSARVDMPLVWTGSRMVVWGGSDVRSVGMATGGRYDPMTDAWHTISESGAPEGRFDHSAIWTGERVLIWGGRPHRYAVLSTGAAYDPELDAWTYMSDAGAPSGRFSHSAVWTGEEMIIWAGGIRDWSPPSLIDGGRYSASLDSWTPMSMLNVPDPRWSHGAVWTGTQMMVWGGFIWPPDGAPGGRYVAVDPPDLDEDGVAACAGDCDDRDPRRFPGAEELCDGVDNDCDGVVPALELDADGDGYTSCGGDCDDANGSAHPGALEFPGNTLDENCDGEAVCSPEGAWKNHGQYVGCVARACETLVSGGFLPVEECDALIKKAARLQTP